MKTFKAIVTNTPTEFTLWERGDPLLEKMFQIDVDKIIVITEAKRFELIEGDRVYLTRCEMNIGWDSWHWIIHKNIDGWTVLPDPCDWPAKVEKHTTTRAANATRNLEAMVVEYDKEMVQRDIDNASGRKQ